MILLPAFYRSAKKTRNQIIGGGDAGGMAGGLGAILSATLLTVADNSPIVNATPIPSGSVSALEAVAKYKFDTSSTIGVKAYTTRTGTTQQTVDNGDVQALIGEIMLAPYARLVKHPSLIGARFRTNYFPNDVNGSIDVEGIDFISGGGLNQSEMTTADAAGNDVSVNFVSATEYFYAVAGRMNGASESQSYYFNNYHSATRSRMYLAGQGTGSGWKIVINHNGNGAPPQTLDTGIVVTTAQIKSANFFIGVMFFEGEIKVWFNDSTTPVKTYTSIPDLSGLGNHPVYWGANKFAMNAMISGNAASVDFLNDFQAQLAVWQTRYSL